MAFAPEHEVASDTGSMSRKERRIRKIVADGGTPEVWILRYGMSGTSDYTDAEATVIDLLMSVPLRQLPHAPLERPRQLTNARREHARGHGIRSLQSLIYEYAAPPLASTHPMLLITLNGENYQPDLLRPEHERRPFAGYKPQWRESAVRVTVFEEIGDSVRGW